MAHISGISIDLREPYHVHANSKEGRFTTKLARKRWRKLSRPIVKRLTEPGTSVDVVSSHTVCTVKRAHGARSNVVRAVAQSTFPRIQLRRQVIEVDEVHRDIRRIKPRPLSDTSKIGKPLGHRQRRACYSHFRLKEIDRRPKRERQRGGEEKRDE